MEDEFDAIAIGDRLRIMDLLARYSWAIDAGDLDAYLACFCSDGVLRHPKRDGSDAEYRGRDGVATFIAPGFADRATQTYGHQHQFNAVRITPHPTLADAARVEAYCMIFRHEFHRQYWPRGASWRMGTWHATTRPEEGRWRVAELDVRMWNDTAFGNGTALVDRGPNMPGVRD